MTCVTCRPSTKRSTRAKNVTLEQIKTLYETQIGGCHAELGVVGDFDPESTLRLVKEMLSGWESKVPYQADRPQGGGQWDGDEGRHPHARQVERGISRGAFVRAFGQRPRLPRAADRQLHFRRQHARLAAGRSHSPEGRTFLRRDLLVRLPRRAIRWPRSRSPSAPTRRTSTRSSPRSWRN